jgi:hypothetical protein
MICGVVTGQLRSYGEVIEGVSLFLGLVLFRLAAWSRCRGWWWMWRARVVGGRW